MQLFEPRIFKHLSQSGIRDWCQKTHLRDPSIYLHSVKPFVEQSFRPNYNFLLFTCRLCRFHVTRPFTVMPDENLNVFCESQWPPFPCHYVKTLLSEIDCYATVPNGNLTIFVRLFVFGQRLGHKRSGET